MSEILFTKFRSNKNSERIAFLETHINSDYFYARGFEMAGLLLYETWVKKEDGQEDNTSIDCIIYPIYTCYRQALELWYKKLIRICKDSNASKMGHKIKELHECLLDSGNLSDNLKKNLLNNTEFIEYIDGIDPSFDRFRYDTTHKGGKQNEKQELDLDAMVNGFSNACKVLDSIWEHFSMNELRDNAVINNNHYNRFK